MNTPSPLQFSDVQNHFLQIDNWDRRYEYLIELGRKLPDLEEVYKTPQYIVKGCQSQVWLHAECRNQKVILFADSDALIVKGLVHLLIVYFQNKSPDEILAAKMDFFDELGFKNHLSPSRTNGVMSVIKQIKMYAVAFKLQNP
jgi:cysteine desulfuration protein SufE